MKSHIIFLFLLGLLIGFVFDFLFRLEPAKKETHQTVSGVPSEINETSIDEVKKIRLFCFLNTMPKSHSLRAVHILNTWSKHCDKLFFASTVTDLNLGAIGFNVTDSHDHMWGKEKLMMQFIYKHFLDDYDWFLKADDDTFLIGDNLRYMLSPYSPEDAIYFGYKFNTTLHKWGYFSGGAGYVMSRYTVRTFVEQVLVGSRFFQNDGDFENDILDGLCHVETDERIEDMEITNCLDQFDVYAGDSRDALKRDRFHMWWPEHHLFMVPHLDEWYWLRKYYWNDEGLDCCSNYSISFHHIVNPQNQYTLYYLTHQLKLYGISRQFPPPPRKYNFLKVTQRLNQERTNKSLRGY